VSQAGTRPDVAHEVADGSQAAGPSANESVSAIVDHSDSRRTPVLIVGAGPAGLTAALDLALRGIDVMIIERSPHASSASRAKGIQPRTLEVLDALGVADEVLICGGAFPRWRSYSSGRVAWEKSIYDLLGIGEPVADPAVPFPETWMIPQWRTEQILRGALSRVGVQVEFGSSLAALDVDDAGVTATISGTAGIRRVDASYVVAADGAASTVRKLVGVVFDGVTRDEERYVIADVRTVDLDRRYWHNWADPNNPAARVSICPLPATDTFQFVAPLLPGESTPPLTLATVQRLFDERSDGVVASFSDAPWITVDRTNERLANSFGSGRVFLVGDAAHTVPAAGGQGLNTAVQDAHNLGWKLATVLRGGPESVLDTYEEERRPIAVRLMAGLGTVDEHGETPDIFQLRDNYRRSSLTEDFRPMPGTVRAGDRAPDAPLQLAGSTPSRLFELLRGADLTCIAFGNDAGDACRAVANRWNPTTALRVLDVRRDSPATAETIHGIYDVAEDDQVVVLVRPDGYIGFAANQPIEERLGVYIRRITAQR